MTTTIALNDKTDILIEKACDRSFSTRLAAQLRLVELGEVAVPRLVRALRETDKRRQEAAEKALLSIGTPAVPYLMSVMKDAPDRKLRWVVADLLSKMKQGDSRFNLPAMTQYEAEALRAKKPLVSEKPDATARLLSRQGMIVAGLILGAFVAMLSNALR